jgi:hypothetical protein
MHYITPLRSSTMIPILILAAVLSVFGTPAPADTTSGVPTAFDTTSGAPTVNGYDTTSGVPTHP